MDERYHYDDVPAILQALEAEGLALSIKHVYERRGRVGSNQSISADIKRWKREQGLIEGSGEDQEEITPRPLPAMPETLPDPDPELVDAARARAGARVNLIIVQSHLQAAIAALRCVDESLAKVIPTLNAHHAQRETREGVHPNNRSTPPYWPALIVVQRQGASVLHAYETILQHVTLVTSEGQPNGHGRPAA